MKPHLHIVASPSDRILAGMDERDLLRKRLAMVEAQLSADVREWSFANGFRVTLRPEQAVAEIEREVGR